MDAEARLAWDADCAADDKDRALGRAAPTPGDCFEVGFLRGKRAVGKDAGRLIDAAEEMCSAMERSGHGVNQRVAAAWTGLVVALRELQLKSQVSAPARRVTLDTDPNVIADAAKANARLKASANAMGPSGPWVPPLPDPGLLGVVNRGYATPERFTSIKPGGQRQAPISKKA